MIDNMHKTQNTVTFSLFKGKSKTVQCNVLQRKVVSFKAKPSKPPQLIIKISLSFVYLFIEKNLIEQHLFITKHVNG
jgi:hypothetical protein